MRLIDADDLEANMLNEWQCGEFSNGDWMLIRKMINDAPSVDPLRIKGNWIRISPAGIYECSICGKNVMTPNIDAYDFCHGCGNPMGVIKNGNERTS